MDMTVIPNSKEVGERLRVLARALNMTDTALAGLLGISPQRLNNYTSGRDLLTPAMAVRVHSRTGATIDWLYRGDMSAVPIALATSLRATMDNLRAG